MRRLVGLLLALFFAAGFTPLRPEPCGCTAEHNCGCSCWKTRVGGDHGTQATGEKACCRLLRGRRAANACGVLKSAHGAHPENSSDPFAPASNHDSREAMEWVLAEVARLEQPRLAASDATFPAAAATEWRSPPLSPPPRAARAI